MPYVGSPNNDTTLAALASITSDENYRAKMPKVKAGSAGFPSHFGSVPNFSLRKNNSFQIYSSYLSSTRSDQPSPTSSRNVRYPAQMAPPALNLEDNKTMNCLIFGWNMFLKVQKKLSLWH